MTLQPLRDTMQTDVARWVDMLAPARSLAEVIAQTEFVPKAMRGKPDVVTAAIMFGDELGLGPMQALQGIDVIEGRPRPSAEMMRALIFRAGHAITVHESTGTRCRVSGLRAGRPEAERVTIDWTLDMAKAAGLLGKSNWRAYPRAMLLARATSDLARVLFPDVVKGLGYVAEDDASAETLEAWAVQSGGEPEPEKPKRKPIQRKTQPKHAAPPPMVEGPPIAPDEQPKHKATRDVLDVDLPPEKPADDEPPADGDTAMSTPQQLSNLHARLAVFLGNDLSDDDRRQVLADLVGRERLESSRYLTREEAYAIRAMLMRVGAGLASLDRNPTTGRWEVIDVPQEEPPDDDGRAWGDLGGGQQG